MFRSTPLFLALTGLLLGACTPKEPAQQTSIALSDGVLLPAYSGWAEADRQLAASALSFCAGNEDLQQARQIFLTAQNSWAALQPLLFGPLAEGNLAWQVQFWPDKKNLVARQVENLLQQKPQLTQADLEQASVVVKGLSAYEYLLFDSGLDLTDATQRQRYCPLLTAIGKHQQTLSAEILQQWQGDAGMAVHLKRFPNSRYADAKEAIGEILRAEVTALDVLKKKLGTPLGRQSKGVPQPLQAESWRSQSTLSNLAASLATAERLWLGVKQDGIRNLLDEDQAELAQRLDQAFGDSRGRLAALQRPFDELLADKAGRAQLNALYDSFDRLHRLHERELAKALDIQLGFNAHDGD
ncbi:imelysin family protein [Azorhizophilus paspali]|uniref:Imelysin family protein n=1 Tax=Azorhizophilus paspali TaxID=69963 RepID=A0ABV6SF52_AZOPA